MGRRGTLDFFRGAAKNSVLRAGSVLFQKTPEV